jgi:hypothetical protein
VFFDGHAVFIDVQRTLGFEGLKLGVMCEPSDWQFSALEQMCDGQASPLMPIIPGVEWLVIEESRDGEVDIGRAQWLEFLRRFIAVETLSLSMRLVPFIMLVLTEEVQLARASRSHFARISIIPRVGFAGRHRAVRRCTPG